MSDLKQYIAKRKSIDTKFSENFEDGYQEFKIGEMLKLARKEIGLTQSDIAKALHTKKSAISRIENHAQDIKLSTLQAFAHAMGKELKIQLAWKDKSRFSLPVPQFRGVPIKYVPEGCTSLSGKNIMLYRDNETNKVYFSSLLEKKYTSFFRKTI